MDRLLVILALGMIAGLLTLLVLASRRRGGAAEGDFEARLEAMRSGRMLPGSSGAAMPASAAALVDAREEPGSAGAAEPDYEPESEYAPVGAPPAEHIELEDPLLGRLTFVGSDEGGEWETSSGAAIGVPGWVTIEAGPEGPGDVERSCLTAFAERREEIIADAIEIAKRGMDLQRWFYHTVEPDSLWVKRESPDDDRARGTLMLSVNGEADGRVSVTTRDDWRTLEAVID